MDKNEICQKKEQWIKEGFIGGALICIYILMQESGYDLVYDQGENLVQEYRELLEMRLESHNAFLIMMINTEIERCYLDKGEKIFPYLSDEIFSHYESYNADYPLEAVGLHIDVIRALYYLNEMRRSVKYLWRLKEEYEYIFGEQSYLFCKNWGYILNEVLMVLEPKTGIKAFEEYEALFSEVLYNDTILYDLYINKALIEVELTKDISYIENAVKLCREKSQNSIEDIKKKVGVSISIMLLQYYRYSGKLDLAIETAKMAIGEVTDLNKKTYLLTQLASIFIHKHEVAAVLQCINYGFGLVQDSHEEDENLAELYNLCGIYHMMVGEYDEAEASIKKAISIGKRLTGEESDLTVKFNANMALVKYSRGAIYEGRDELMALLKVMVKNGGVYRESYPYVLNNIILMSMETKLDASAYERIKTIVRNKNNSYDMLSTILFKCNLFYILQVSQIVCEDQDIRSLEKELDEYFLLNPDSEAYKIYLCAMVYKYTQSGEIKSAHLVLERLQCIFEQMYIDVKSREYLTYFVIKFRVYLYNKKFVLARRWLLGMWDQVLFPLFSMSHVRSIDCDLGANILLQLYSSLFVSAVQQFPEIKITSRELYEFVLNYKYLTWECNSENMNKTIDSKKLMSLKDIKGKKSWVVLECFDYIKYDLKDNQDLLLMRGRDVEASFEQMCFGLEFTQGLFGNSRVSILNDICLSQLLSKLEDSFQDYDTISEFEKNMWDRLESLLNGKKRIYVCTDQFVFPYPLAAMKQTNGKYWGEEFEIIYCNVGTDIREDIAIQDLSDSVFLGVSEFTQELSGNDRKIKDYQPDLYFAGMEAEILADITQGEVYLNNEVSEVLHSRKTSGIIHIATHTDNKGNALVIGNETDGGLITIEVIENMNWENVCLLILSGCETGEESLRQAVRKSGVLTCIATLMEVEDGVNAFFMVCFYKKLMQYKKVIKAFYEAQREMQTIKKAEILRDKDYLNIKMEDYLQDYKADDRPFDCIDDWAGYVLFMN